MSKRFGVVERSRPQKSRPPPSRKSKGTQLIYKSSHSSLRAKLFIHTVGTNPSVDQETGGAYQTVLSQNDVFSGSTNPNWRDQVRNGQSATTAASGTRYSYVSPWFSSERRVFINSTKRNLYAEFYGHIPFSAGVATAPTSDQKSVVEDRAKRKILERLDSVLSSVELGQDLGEYKETVHGVTKPLKSLRDLTLGYFDALTNLRRSFKHPSPGALKALADTYLEWTFGWKPLALDIADAIVGLQNRSRFRFTPIEASAVGDYSASSSSPTQYAGDPFALQQIWTSTKIQRSYSTRYKGMVRVDLESGTLPVRDVLQLDLPHFIPTVWDLIPYSFVVDYFTNVGDIIRSYCARTNSIAWCVKTTRTTYTTTVSYWSKTNPSNPPSADVIELACRDDSQNSIAQRVDFTRAPVNPSVELRPSFHFELPVSDKPWINIGAIIASRTAHLVPLFR